MWSDGKDGDMSEPFVPKGNNAKRGANKNTTPNMNFSANMNASNNQSTVMQKNNASHMTESSSPSEETFKGNFYFMKFEHYLKEFNCIYMLKIYHKPIPSESLPKPKDSIVDDSIGIHPKFNIESGKFEEAKRAEWKCYVFDGFWKGKSLGGPRVNIEQTYASNVKSRFKQEEKPTEVETNLTSKPANNGSRGGVPHKSKSHRQKDSGNITFILVKYLNKLDIIVN